MKFIIILILLIAAGIFFLLNYFNNQQNLLHHQIIVLQRNNAILKKQLSKYDINKNISIQYIMPIEKLVTLKSGTKIFLCPIEDSIIVNCCAKETEVELLDQCILNSTCWYYIKLLSETNVNCHGWVEEVNILPNPCT